MPVIRSRTGEIPAERRPAPRMEGAMARWYARNRGSAAQLAQNRAQALSLTAPLPPGAAVLDVAPGPGYQAIEFARLGFTVTGLDLSRTFVGIATENARRAGVAVRFVHGDAAELPFPAGSFDLVVCQAAFKNFARPVRALDEMHRVLRPGGLAVIQDMNHDVTRADIAREVAGQGLGRWNAFLTRAALAGLRRRAATRAQFEGLVSASAFRTCTVGIGGIGLEIRLRKPA